MAKKRSTQYVLLNDYHGTSCTVHTPNGTLTTEQCDRVRKTLCPNQFLGENCRCNGGALNQRSADGRNPHVKITDSGVCRIG